MAASIDDLDKAAETILRILCSQNCQASLKQLHGILNQERQNHYTAIMKIVEMYPHTFRIQPARRIADVVVSVHAPVPLCEDHCTKRGECQQMYSCNALHICKFFLLSHCTQQRCIFGHSLKTPHNMAVLQPYLMDRLNDRDIKIIMTHINNRTFLTKPDICKFFNIAQGCSKPKCPFLHICYHFIHESCNFGRRCKRSHNITDPDVISILARYGINTERADHQILADLRFLLDGNGTALSRHGSVSALDGYAPDSHGKGRRSRSLAASRQNRRMRSPSPGSPLGVLYSEPNPFCQATEWSLSQAAFDPEGVDFQGARPKVNTASSGNPRGRQSQGVNPGYRTQISETDKDSPEICMYKLKGKCWYSAQCIRHHKDMIYQWQYQLRLSQEWKDFDDVINLEIEKNYCLPEQEECFIRLFSEVVRIFFANPMTGNGKTIKMSVRRLSTVSSEAPSALPAMVQWTTEWRWYWKGPGGKWIEYGEKDATGMKSSQNSETLEQKYLENTKGETEFKTGHFTYRLNFDAMMQENTLNSNLREVRRRPHFFKKGDLEKRKHVQSSSVDVPEEWSVQKFKTAKTLLGHYNETKIERHSEEFQKIEELFRKTVPRNKIKSISRIENGELWTSFQMKGTQMTTKAGKQVKELSLFHGTEEGSVDAICHQGFDFRFSGDRVGAKLGRGSYFARDAKYSIDYCTPDTSGFAKMFVARVLVGDYTLGSCEYKRPPQKNVNDRYELYDSCVNNERDPSIYVIFSLEQTYPEYLITFEKKQSYL